MNDQRPSRINVTPDEVDNLVIVEDPYFEQEDISNDVDKGGGLPPGTKRRWYDGVYEKQVDGSWKRVGGMAEARRMKEEEDKAKGEGEKKPEDKPKEKPEEKPAEKPAEKPEPKKEPKPEAKPPEKKPEPAPEPAPAEKPAEPPKAKEPAAAKPAAAPAAFTPPPNVPAEEIPWKKRIQAKPWIHPRVREVNSELLRLQGDGKKRISKEWGEGMTADGKTIVRAGGQYHGEIRWSMEEVREMRRQGMEFHTHTHPSNAPFSWNDLNFSVTTQCPNSMVETAKGTHYLQLNQKEIRVFNGSRNNHITRSRHSYSAFSRAVELEYKKEFKKVSVIANMKWQNMINRPPPGTPEYKQDWTDLADQELAPIWPAVEKKFPGMIKYHYEPKEKA